MTLVAGRLPSLHTLERSSYGEDGSMQGILKSGLARRVDRAEMNPYVSKQAEHHNQRSEDGKRLVRFSETEERGRQRSIDRETEKQDVIMFGSNMYFINNSDPNSAVRKLFPNSKLTPLAPIVNRPSIRNSNQSHVQTGHTFESNRNVFNRSKSDSEDGRSVIPSRRKVDGNVLRRSMVKIPAETRSKSVRPNSTATPLIERIKQLTCETANEESKAGKPGAEPKCAIETRIINNETDAIAGKHMPSQFKEYQEKAKDLPKQTKEGLNLMRYNQNISHSRTQQATENKYPNINKSNMADEARRSFMSSLSQCNQADPGDRTSVSTNSTTADTVYSLSDIDEALTEEEKEIKDAFAQENKQDELEIFVQQDARRTERLRKRYSSTPRPDHPVPTTLASSSFPLVYPEPNTHYFPNSNSTIRKDKPKFGSTIEILQQLQQQIDTPYQLEGRRTACSNYSDSSIPISERLFCDESSDGYEPINPKLNVQRTYSLDSKNYEEIDNFPSAFSVPRTKSHELPSFNHLESDPYLYPPAITRYPGHVPGRNQHLDQNVYSSSPDLHRYYFPPVPDRVSSYNNHLIPGRQLHPVLQRQYCRYNLMDPKPGPAEEGKILTPPSRMHTYMNVPTNAPCYSPPPSYSKHIHYPTPPVCHFDTSHIHSNVYQNVPLPSNPHVLAIRRLCTERERGVPEGASASTSVDLKEMYSPPQNDYYFPHSVPASIPKSSVPHHYCVDV